MDEVAKVVNEKGCKRVLVMCTAGLRKYHLYERSFIKFSLNTEVVYPNDEIQELVTKGICNAKNTCRYTNPADEPEHPYNLFMKVCNYYRDRGDIDCIIGGCTDISNVFFPKFADIEYIDSLDVLSKCIVLKHNNNI